ncbi:hypothetical protein WDV76_09760 [Xenorhabdus griffiniae]|uniref:hypothetical protein n=1 Tax=Xenorhabdus griffiniae TaxID=351672 RepID=UPI002359A2BD|nr:hypothetical protein [Xenorhabdus griffiniae]MDC9604390.1 hypothetical protein [Xenorhabdus griffiniae]
MKTSLSSLFFMVFICGMSFSFIAISGEWLLTDKSIYQLNWLHNIKLGSLVGGGGGAIIWLAYRFKWL